MNPIYQGLCWIYLDDETPFRESHVTFYLNGDKLIGFVNFADWKNNIPSFMDFLNEPIHKVELDNRNSAHFIFDRKPGQPSGEFGLRYSSGITTSPEEFFLPKGQ